jgi:hypothetical protein
LGMNRRSFLGLIEIFVTSFSSPDFFYKAVTATRLIHSIL